MDVYQTNTDGVFVGITTADQDPMDATNWLIPAGCVDTSPPSITDSQFAKWDGSAWSVEDIPVEEPTPEPEPLDPADEARAKRDGLLASSDWTQVADAPVNKARWASYRALLRFVPQQAGFPQTVTWPTQPEVI
tara:strand:+ start:1540 stop:1941 length:402 start_codon:yes stop_codon:yes gene_type:complete